MAVRVSKDGTRTVYTGADYTRLKWRNYEEQGRCCADCHYGFPFNRLEFHHYGGRGMNGSKRNDLDPRNRMLCLGALGCHEKARFEHLRDRERDLAGVRT